MSNRIVPATYRAIIDDVMSNIRNDFAEFGVDEDVLAELQHKWEQKVVESNVAEFEPGPPQAPVIPPHQLHPPPPPPMQVGLSVPQPRLQQPYPATSSSPAPPHPHYSVKPEPHDPSFVLPNLPGPGPPPGMAGPQLMLPRVAIPPGFSVQQLQAMQLHMFQQQQHHQQAAQQPLPNIKQQSAPTPGPTRLPQLDGPSSFSATKSSQSVPQSGKKSSQIPQLDGPSSNSDSSSSRSSESPPPEGRNGAAANSTAAVQAPARATTGVNPDEEINSDLDDDDSDVDDDDAAATNNADGGGPGDIVYCTYDKVQRVKNKWKCTLKDGIISVNGKDYLFSKCAGEFEW